MARALAENAGYDPRRTRAVPQRVAQKDGRAGARTRHHHPRDPWSPPWWRSDGNGTRRRSGRPLLIKRKGRVRMPTSPERKVYRLQAQIAQALAHPLRLEILKRLEKGEVPFGKIQAQVHVSKANLSQHLSIMRRAGIVVDRREGNTTYYRLAYPEILRACRCLADVLHQHLSSGAKLASAARPMKK